MDFLFHPYRVSEIAQRLRDVLTSDDVLSDAWVQGEITNYTRAASGHLYFSLKDSEACLKSVMWKSQAARLARAPRDGEAVYAHGHFDLYPVRGDVQFYVDQVQFIGAGLLFQKYQELKARLEEEGLFAEGHKRPIPKFPRRIGLVTSREGAVLHDILHILERRYPVPELFLAPCAVQGEAAPSQIVSALQTVARVPGLDVILLARGGGSFEDLFCFNDELVARAIYTSPVPVISGVGHETDFTIADFVADLRAPTPTAAAQFCTPDQNELRATLLLQERRLGHALRGVLGEARRRLRSDRGGLQRASPASLLARRRQQVDDLSRAAAGQLRRAIALDRERLRGATRHLESVNPQATLERGYAIVRAPDGRVISTVAQATRGAALEVRVRDGDFRARVE